MQRNTGCNFLNNYYGRLIVNVIPLFTSSQKFEDPAEGEEALVGKFKKLYDDLTAGFRNLEEEAR